MTKIQLILFLFSLIFIKNSSASDYKVKKFVVRAPIENTQISYKNGEGERKNVNFRENFKNLWLKLFLKQILNSKSSLNLIENFNFWLIFIFPSSHPHSVQWWWKFFKNRENRQTTQKYQQQQQHHSKQKKKRNFIKKIKRWINTSTNSNYSTHSSLQNNSRYSRFYHEFIERCLIFF